LVLSVVVGKRTEANATAVVHEVRERTDGRPLNLITTDEYTAYTPAIAAVYAEPAPEGETVPEAERLPEWLVYATVHQTREQNRVVKVASRLVFGTLVSLAAALVWSVLGCVSTVFIERSNGTDRHRNARKGRKTYRFSKDWEVHRALTFFTWSSANVCWAVRTLREEILPKKKYRERTPAMVAGLTDHVWTLKEWLLFPSTKRYQLSPFSRR
jgi:IS1 family transposase